MATGDRRPTVALVAVSLGHQPGLGHRLAELVSATSDRFRFVGVASHVPADLHHHLEWHRIAPGPGSLRVRWATFFVRASLFLRTQRPDLIHMAGPSPLVAQRVDLATVTFHWASYDRALRAGGQHRPSVVEAIGRWTMLTIERRLYRSGRVHMLATVSEPARRELAAAVPGVPVALTPEGVDCRRFAPNPAVGRQMRAARGVSQDEVVAVFVGLERRDTKGLALAISAFARARAAGTGPTRLWVLGTAGARWRRLVTRLGLEHEVDLLGFRNDVEHFLAAADLFVLPTVYEVSCRAAHEAAACGVPVVAPAVHAVAELIGDDQAGLIVSRNVDSIANALNRLAGDGELRVRLGSEGRRRALAIGHTGYPQAVASLYERLLAGPAATGRFEAGS
jgi:glycosyltransferase involved in cell wall biosynthesis